ncbi:MAG: mechanosensitive ion channel [Dehalococcoidia bacterium]
MRDWFDELEPTTQDYLPNIIAALIILVIGWLIAIVVSSIVRGILHRTTWDERLARSMGVDREGRNVDVGNWIAKAVFWVILIFTFVAFFDALNIAAVSGPLDQLLSQVFFYLPRIVGAGILLLIAWIVARVVRALVTRGLEAVNVDERLGNEMDAQRRPATAATTADLPQAQTPAQQPAAPRPSVAQTLGDVAYWLVFLLFIPLILSALRLPGLLEPVQAFIEVVLTFIPSLAAAAIILVIGWFVARILQRIVTGLLNAAGVDRLAERVGADQVLGTQTISSLLGLLVYVLVLIPVVIVSLDTLGLTAVSEPASAMLESVFNAIPLIFAAAVILIIAYFVGRLLSSLVAGLLSGFGFDNILQRLGFTQQQTVGERTPSQIVGYVVLVATMLFASIEAAEVLRFTLLADIIRDFTVFAGQVVMGLIILAIGIYLANLVYGLVRDSNVAQAGLLAMVARVAILVLAIAMALRQMGLAQDIVNLAFGLLLGAVAVAAAIAFGLGGREVAGRELERFIEGRRAAQPLPAGPSSSPISTSPATEPADQPPNPPAES